jgi:hypothetical protein
MNEAYEGEWAQRAEAAIDQVAMQSHAWHRKRPRAFTARDALIALQFEATLLHVVSAAMREGSALNDEDHERLVVACGRINVIVDEVVG